MLQKFSKDHKYKFSKEQFKKDLGEKRYKRYIDINSNNKSWINYCEGKMVKVETEEDGWVICKNDIGVKGYSISPQWCICVGRND